MKFLKKIPRWIGWTLLVLAVAYIALVIYRIPAVGRQEQDAKMVAYINAQHITLADVMGTNLPNEPYEPKNDATVAGVDANDNGIRDDVELAIFKEYPNSAKIRAAELQYAMTEEMFLTQVTDTATWKAVAEQDSRAYNCILEIGTSGTLTSSSLSKEVENMVFDNQQRLNAENTAFNFETSHGTAQGDACDIDLSSLPN